MKRMPTTQRECLSQRKSRCVCTESSIEEVRMKKAPGARRYQPHQPPAMAQKKPAKPPAQKKPAKRVGGDSAGAASPAPKKRKGPGAGAVAVESDDEEAAVQDARRNVYDMYALQNGQPQMVAFDKLRRGPQEMQIRYVPSHECCSVRLLGSTPCLPVVTRACVLQRATRSRHRCHPEQHQPGRRPAPRHGSSCA